MNKISLVAFFLTCSVISCFGQKTNTSPQLSIGGEFGLPVGRASEIYGSVFGGSVKLEVPVIHPGLSVTVTGGISAYVEKFYYAGPFKNATYLPLELGGKYYFSKVAYVEGDAGVSFFNGTNNYSTSQKTFIYAPVIGVSAPTNHHKNTIDLGLRYESRVDKTGTVSQIAVRLAYRFKI